jgi:hypothetical protein
MIAKARSMKGRAVPTFDRKRFPGDDKPWIPDEEFECRHTICPKCDNTDQGKTIVSLDAVLNGDISPSLAVGLSFEDSGRPVADANVVKNLGCQAVPLVRNVAFLFGTLGSK